MKAETHGVVLDLPGLSAPRAPRCLPSRLLLLLTASLLLGACNLVGYDQLRDPAQADDDGGLADAPGDGGPRARNDGNLDGGLGGDLDAALHPLDASFVLDGALLEAGWWNGRTPDQTCAAGQKCYPNCEPSAGTCVFDCAGAASCENTCLPGTACEVACEQVGRCFMACKEDSQCWLDCQDTPDCVGWCSKGTHCQIDCADAKTCNAMCLVGSSCELDCRDGADCSAFSCSLGAECLVQCGAGGCDFGCEGDGNGSSCPGNIRVCHRACP